MRTFCLNISVLILLSGFNTDILNEVRTHYVKFSSDKELCQKMMEKLSGTKHISTTHLAYLGSLKTIWANHVFSPIGKLNAFEEGKKDIEQAIQKESENVEVRFIRLSVQKNAPAFLGYRSKIKEDTEFIRNNLNRVSSQMLRNNIEKMGITN